MAMVSWGQWTWLIVAVVGVAASPAAAEPRTIDVTCRADRCEALLLPGTGRIRVRVTLDRALREIIHWLDRAIDSREPLRQVAGAACQARLAVAIVKICSSSVCSADHVEAMLSRPEDYFAADSALPGALCWRGGHYLPPDSAALVQFRDLAMQGMNMLGAGQAEKGRDRAVTAVRMLFALGREAAACGKTDATDEQRCARMTEIEGLSAALLQEDFVGALTATTRLVQTYGAVPDALDKGLQLIGSVTAYAKVYNETKDEDPKAARDARKKALEALIDPATDRHGRGGTWILSLGSNVGLAYTRSWTHADPVTQTDPVTGGNAMTPASPDLRRHLPWVPEVRVPLGVTIQLLPDECHIGVHLGLQLGNLGQFVASGDNGRVDAARWDSFVAPGLEAGLLFGAPHRAISLTAHLEYSPSLFPTSDGRASGALRFGASLGYYVPFFDLN